MSATMDATPERVDVTMARRQLTKAQRPPERRPGYGDARTGFRRLQVRRYRQLHEGATRSGTSSRRARLGGYYLAWAHAETPGPKGAPS